MTSAANLRPWERLRPWEAFNPHHKPSGPGGGQFTTGPGGGVVSDAEAPWQVEPSADEEEWKKHARINYGNPANAFNNVEPQDFGTLEAGLVSFENDANFAQKDFEAAALFTPDGKRLLVQLGEARAVPFTPDQVDGMRTDRVILTHNHPTGSSLSSGDVMMAVRNRLTEMRAFGTGYDGVRRTYSLKPGPGGWPHPDVLMKALEKAGEAVRAKFDPLVENDQISTDEANLQFNHEVWKEVERLGSLDRELVKENSARRWIRYERTEHEAPT